MFGVRALPLCSFERMSIRTERVARVIQRDLADILGNELQSPSHTLVTVTGVRMSPDLSIAYVHLSVLGGTAEERQSSFRRIDDATVQIRSMLAARIRHQVRAVPELRFFLDESQAHAERIELLLGQIRDERSSRTGPETDPDVGDAADEAADDALNPPRDGS